MATSKAVFLGSVSKVTQLPPMRLSINGQESFTFTGSVATVRVEKSWKGVRPGTTVHVATGPHGGMCGYWFEEKLWYLIYARKGKEGGDTLTTNICSRTTSIKTAGKDLDALGKPLKRRRFWWL